MKSDITILRAMTDPELFGKTFKRRGLLHRDSWKAWRAFLTALFGLSLDADSLAIYQKHTGRQSAPTKPFSEAWAICGRRSGKSVVAAATAVYLACFRDYRGFLAPGEIGVLPIIAPDRRQCRTILGYVNGLFDASPTLGSMVKNRLKESIDLVNGVRIEIATADFKTVRGYTCVAAVIDEAAFLRSEDSATPDTELIAAITPAMSTIPNAVLLGISSPYSRRGVLWRNFKEHYGKDNSPVLIWRAPSREMNPTLNPIVVQAALLRDRAAASSEYLAEFRSDLETFLPLEVIEACVIPERRELPPLQGESYFAFTDPSGGRSDAMTLAIAHRDKSKATLDCLREVQPPFSPENVVREFAETLRRYRLSSVTGDKYGAEWVQEQFEKAGIQYKPSEKSRSEIYLEALPMLVSEQAELLDHPRLVAQLASLERRTSRAGKDAIDHPPSGHDDLSNSACGALVEALRSDAILGLVEFLKSGAAQKFLETSTLRPVVAPVLPSCCPLCAGPRTYVGGCGLRCSQCGAVYANDSDRTPIYELRSEAACCDSPLFISIGDVKRCQQCGWQSNQPRPKGVPRKVALDGTWTGGRAVMNSGSFRHALARVLFGGRK
jgi:hypothetical protein